MEGQSTKKVKFEHTFDYRLRQYYETQFDWDLFERILTCDGRYALTQRPVQFWFDVPTKRVMYESMTQLKRVMLQKPPTQVFMSCLWPREQDARHKPYVERELILDIDMNDYADVRILCDCGKEKRCCDQCWQMYMNDTAIPILRYTLGHVCGFKHVRYAYSGRRGMHVIVSDERVMTWTVAQRQQFLRRVLRDCDEYVYENILWPVFRRYFWDVPRTQLSEPLLQHMRTTLPDDTWSAFGGEPRVGAMMTYAQQKLGDSYKRWAFGVATYALAPRYDECFFNSDVTHVLKCPLTVHKATGHVCQMLDAEDPSFLPSRAKKI